MVAAKAVFNLHALSGEDFERVIKSFLMEMGFEAELTEVTGDGGIDIIAKLDKPLSGAATSFNARGTQRAILWALLRYEISTGLMADRATKGIFITTSDFTTQAKEFAMQSGVELVNLPKLLQLFEDNGLTQYR